MHVIQKVLLCSQGAFSQESGYRIAALLQFSTAEGTTQKAIKHFCAMEREAGPWMCTGFYMLMWPLDLVTCVYNVREVQVWVWIWCPFFPDFHSFVIRGFPYHFCSWKTVRSCKIMTESSPELSLQLYAEYLPRRCSRFGGTLLHCYETWFIMDLLDITFCIETIMEKKCVGVVGLNGEVIHV